MKSFIKFLGVVLFIICFSPLFCSAQQTECIKLEQDGSMTVRAHGTGKNRADAMEQAQKQALNDVIFRGGIKGTFSYYQKPILTTLNAREKYGEYFDVFFRDGGEYKKYVSMADKRAGSTFVNRSKIEVECEMTVRVLIPQLKERFKTDGLIRDNG